jgi:kanamycin kinase
VKVAPVDWEPSLTGERARLEWAGSRLPVPRVLDHGRSDGIEWLLTEELPGVDATRAEVRGDPASLVTWLAGGLRDFHEVSPRDCPFDFTLGPALAHVRRRVGAGLVDPGRHFRPEHRHLTPSEALEKLESDRPSSEDVVVCHGDYCLPNVLITGGRVSGYLDLGELGLADRWWDLAAATWSVTWNLGPGWEDALLQAYGVAPDPDRLRYYRLLYDLAS